ncbi:MAG: hypothetical protein WCS48_05550 [Candidatus Izemoplasmatales bacterium]|jgi:hypothetical protein|nr:hypothetical protein [Candidatus Izemoplasmatales bacterium]
MNSLKTKVILTGLVLIFAIAASFGTTYAWFTISNTVNVDSMTINVQSGESLLIRVFKGEYIGTDPLKLAADEASLLDASTYKNSLTQADILASTSYAEDTVVLFPGYQNLLNWRLAPVTAAESGYMALNGKSLKTMNILTKALTETTDSNDDEGDFIELKFWLMAQVNAENIILSDLAITYDPEDNLLAAQDNVIYAVNVAVWRSQVKDVPTADTAKIYSINPDYGFAFTSGMNGGPTDPDAFAPFVLTTAQIDALLDDHALFDSATDEEFVSVADKTLATTLAALTADTPTLITVRIYIEGWDAQMTNAILASKFDIAFAFEIKNAD